MDKYLLWRNNKNKYYYPYKGFILFSVLESYVILMGFAVVYKLFNLGWLFK